ncbi:CHAT domain-containing protein [Paraflavitalea pollutisoli]|uniref:CHAT domain-containing protein n=1 Tax=Paraflavitalea pollutisoli TaxID=3034143 RepID=UPI0023ED0B23|nr:CHAT domain-containing protein [Paraflavitalea sp. H1-2-19X]
MGKYITLLFCSWLWFNGAKAQCPGRDAWVQRIAVLKAAAPRNPDSTRWQLQLLQKELIRCGYRDDSTHIQLLRAIATTYVLQQKNEDVIRVLQQALDILRQPGYRHTGDSRDLVQLHYFIALYYNKTGNIPEAMTALENCVTTSRSSGFVDPSALTAFYERGEYFYDLGDYHRSLEYFQECNDKATHYLPLVTNAADSQQVMSYAHSSFVWQINSHVRLRQYDIAEQLLSNQVGNQALRRLSAYQGTYYGLRAEVELHKGRYDLALSDLKKALTLEKNALPRKQLLNTLATEIYFRHLKQYDQALAIFKTALSTINKDPGLYKADSVESVNIWSNMGELYTQQGQFGQAQSCFSRALDHIHPGITAAEIVRTPPADFMRQKKTHYLTGLFMERGNTWQRKYQETHQGADLDKAIAAYREADQLVNRIKTEQANLNSKLFWRRSSHGLYEAALEACYLSGNVEEAFYFFEKSRAVLLNDQLADQRWMGEQDIRLQTQSMKRVSALNRELESPILTIAERSSLLAEKVAHQQKLDSLRTLIKQRNPFYYQSFIDSNFITLSQVQNGILRDYGALVEVFAGDSAVYMLVVDAQRTQLRRIDKQRYDSLASAFNRYITTYSLQNDDFGTFSDIAHRLHALIFAGVQLPPGRLIISPDGAYFPYEALQTTAKQGSYLLREHAISYTYSARYLLNDFTVPPGRETRSFMGVAPVQYGYSQLPELAESDRSLRMLTGYFSSADNFIGKDASRHNFLQHFTDYRIIQLYTHALDNKEDGEPTIYFSDSMLPLSELVSDRRPATSLVVLSACETGTGKFYQGEGVFSFNRGFAALGIPAAITSLWKADNRKTYTLTSLFYKFLSAGEPADVALQHAKLEFMTNASKENMLPYFWAVPVLTGKITAIPAAETASWWLLIPALVLVLIVIGVAVGWWRKKKRAYTGQALVD